MNTKEIIMNAIVDRLSGSGVLKVILQFNCEDDTYNVMLKLESGNINDTEISKSEMNTIKKIFIRRLIAKWNSMYADEPIAIIIEIDLEARDINTYVKTKKSKNNVLKFDYI